MHQTDLRRKRSSTKCLWGSPTKAVKRNQYTKQAVKHVEIFLIHVLTGSEGETTDIQRFFAKSVVNYEQAIFEKRVFFTYKQARRYFKFHRGDYLLLHAYVPETAIQGQIGQVILKPGCLCTSNIRGCYCSWLLNNMYFVNPQFNVLLLTKPC